MTKETNLDHRPIDNESMREKKHSHFEQMKSNKIVCLIALLKMIIIIVMAIEFEWNWDTLCHHRSSYNYWIFI